MGRRHMTVRFAWGEHPVTRQLHCITSGDLTVLRGLRCPECLNAIVPVLPDIRAKHFRHSVDLNCGGGLESVAHRVAKQILSEGLTLLLPARICRRWPNTNGSLTTETLAAPAYVTLQQGRQEVTIESGHRVDVMTTARRANRSPHALAIEIHVAHKTDNPKGAALRHHGYHAIELHVSSRLALMTYEEARDYLCMTAGRRWISDPTGDRYARLARAKARPAFRNARKVFVKEQRRRHRAQADARARSTRDINAELANRADVRRRQWAELDQRRKSAEIRQRQLAAEQAEADVRREGLKAEAHQVLSDYQTNAKTRWQAEPLCQAVSIVDGEQLGRFIGITPDGIIGFVPSPRAWQAAALFDLFLRPIDNGDDVLDMALDSCPRRPRDLVAGLTRWMRQRHDFIVCRDFFRWGVEEYTADPIGMQRMEQLRHFFGGHYGIGTPSHVADEIGSVWYRNITLLQYWRDRNLGRGQWASE